MDELKGKTALITGANSGIGKETARGLAAKGARVYFAGRSEASNLAAMEEVSSSTGNSDLHFLPLDLTDLASAKACAAAFLEHDEPLHILVNNAGVAQVRGVTAQGFELTFGVNHLGHFVLTLGLEAALVREPPTRVVVVASRAHERTHSFDFGALRKPYFPPGLGGWPAYQRSKLANVLFARGLAKRWQEKGVHVYALHPGVVATQVFRKVPGPIRKLILSQAITPEEGAAASLHCAASEDVAADTGRYYDKDGSERTMNPLALDDGLVDALWQYSLDAARDYLPV